MHITSHISIILTSMLPILGGQLIQVFVIMQIDGGVSP